MPTMTRRKPRAPNSSRKTPRTSRASLTSGPWPIIIVALAYLAEGDYENARASFKGGMLQDTLAADEKFNADFASLAFLEGWSSHCMGRKDAAASRLRGGA